jgi:hypothetical protein
MIIVKRESCRKEKFAGGGGAERGSFFSNTTIESFQTIISAPRSPFNEWTE